MAGITLAQAEAQLTTWLTASTAVAAGQSYEIAGRRLTRVNAAEIQSQIDYWDRKAKELTYSATRSRARTVVPGG